jgi:hypothetical protein
VAVSVTLKPGRIAGEARAARHSAGAIALQSEGITHGQGSERARRRPQGVCHDRKVIPAWTGWTLANASVEFVRPPRRMLFCHH